jgi:hypothetical protein
MNVCLSGLQFLNHLLFRKKKDGRYSHPFFRDLNLNSYFFLVFAGALAAGFFAVPQDVPLDLHAITNLLHKRYFHSSTACQYCQQMKCLHPALADIYATGI